MICIREDVITKKRENMETMSQIGLAPPTHTLGSDVTLHLVRDGFKKTKTRLRSKVFSLGRPWVSLK